MITVYTESIEFRHLSVQRRCWWDVDLDAIEEDGCDPRRCVRKYA